MKHRILVIEDNPANSELLCDWLEAQGYQPIAAENLEQAFAAFESELPDAVLLDVQLGAEDGLSLARWIRQQPHLCHLPILAVTAHAMVTDHERVIQSGCNAWISKPVDFKLLSQQLDRWLLFAERVEKPQTVPERR
ncbi:MAG: response regulator [Candidatus Acidiferrales bacterium]